jgi:hypothetical protein
MAPEPAIKWVWRGVRLNRILPPRVLGANGPGPRMVADGNRARSHAAQVDRSRVGRDFSASAEQVMIGLPVDGRQPAPMTARTSG